MTVTRIIDFTPLERLLSLAGPSGAPELVAALMDDLKATQASLDLAWNGPDFAALRANSHVLMGLAGTVGDTDLHALAQRLNRGAHTQTPNDTVDITQSIMTYLADLIAQLHNKAGL